MSLSEQEHLLSLLRELGETKEKVANKLREEKCRGEITSFAHCPVANYLRRHYSNVDDVLVCAECVIDFHGGGRVQVITPPPVSDFIYAFDHDEYPDLEQS